MNNFEFIKYENTPGEKHLGIATIKAFGKVILRYKIIQNKEGNGFFPVSASYKMPSQEGQNVYLAAFLLDSRSDEEEISALIRANIKNPLAKSPSVMASLPSVNDEVPF